MSYFTPAQITQKFPGNVEQIRCINVLNKRHPELSQKDRSFAVSLVDQFLKKTTLSEKQWVWVEALADKIEAKDVPVFADVVSEPEPQVSYAAIHALLASAGKKLKWPSIEVKVNNLRTKFQFGYTYGPFMNKVRVYVNGGTYGTIDQPGQFVASGYGIGAHNAEKIAILKRFMAQFAADPAGVMAEAGKQAGRCCMCGKGLEDPKSLAVGYGPVCAKNYGLPYGAAVAKAKGSPFLAEAV